MNSGMLSSCLSPSRINLLSSAAPPSSSAALPYHHARPDLLIMAVTSQPPSAHSVGEAQVQDWRAAGLLKPSVLKPILTTIDPALVLKKLGQLTSTDQTALRQALATILE